MDQELEKLVDDMVDLHKKYYAAGNEEILPTFTLGAGTRVDVVLVVPLPEHEWQKNIVVKMIREKALAEGHDTYSFSSEAWCVAIGLGQSRSDFAPYLGEDPERQEILTVYAGRRYGESAHRQFVIERGEDGMVKSLTPKEGGFVTYSRWNIFAEDELLTATPISPESTRH